MGSTEFKSDKADTNDSLQTDRQIDRATSPWDSQLSPTSLPGAGRQQSGSERMRGLQEVLGREERREGRGEGGREGGEERGRGEKRGR